SFSPNRITAMCDSDDSMDNSLSDNVSVEPMVPPTVEDWIDLLHHLKTLPTALSCLVYVANAFNAVGELS
ncbi:hypothetical protein PENTCL1PPCAC_22135, partial [Pristionchus entomophagus]